MAVYSLTCGLHPHPPCLYPCGSLCMWLFFNVPVAMRLWCTLPCFQHRHGSSPLLPCAIRNLAHPTVYLPLLAQADLLLPPLPLSKPAVWRICLTYSSPFPNPRCSTTIPGALWRVDQRLFLFSSVRGCSPGNRSGGGKPWQRVLKGTVARNF